MLNQVDEVDIDGDGDVRGDVRGEAGVCDTDGGLDAAGRHNVWVKQDNKFKKNK
jgi:hypothetical protein